MSKTKVRKFMKNGMVNAIDYKFTGEEIDWTGWESWSEKTFDIKFRTAMSFYSYYLDTEDIKQFAISWMKDNGYDQKTIDLVDAGPRYYPEPIAGKIARCISRGMPNEYGGKDYVAVIKEYVKRAIDWCREHYEHYEEKKDAFVKSPEVELEEKIQEITGEIDNMIDDWTKNSSVTKVNPINVIALIQLHGIPKKSLQPLIDSIVKYKKELDEAYFDKDPEMIEALQFYSRPALKNRIMTLNKMIEEIESYSQRAAPKRKERKKKEVPPAKQVENLHFLEKDEENNLTSINPETIIGSRGLILWNSKYRNCMIYQSSSGLSVKGSTLHGFDKDACMHFKVRKPDEFLPKILNASTFAEAQKIVNELIKCKINPPNGRINKDTIIVKVLS